MKSPYVRGLVGGYLQKPRLGTFRQLPRTLNGVLDAQHGVPLTVNSDLMPSALAPLTMASSRATESGENTPLSGSSCAQPTSNRCTLAPASCSIWMVAGMSTPGLLSQNRWLLNPTLAGTAAGAPAG